MTGPLVLAHRGRQLTFADPAELLASLTRLRLEVAAGLPRGSLTNEEGGET